MIKSEGALVIQWYSNLISSSDETGAKISSFRSDSIPAVILGTIGILIEKHNSTWNQSHQVGTFGNGDNFTVIQSYPSSRWKCSKWDSVKNQDRLCLGWGKYDSFKYENKVTTRWEGPQSLSYHKYLLSKYGLMYMDSCGIEFVKANRHTWPEQNFQQK